MILYIRDFNDDGQFIYLLIFIGAWITDIFAYFTGFFFGKHKLIEDVSPKKTIEGSIGGIAFCALSFVAFGIIADIFFDKDANLVFLAISGVFISIIAQIGDLIMSVIKRQYGIKDYGKIFPGHGGMLDRFDSILSVTLGVAAMCMVSYIFGISMM
jgi:phosphatidate cytidylyltransferase